MSLLPKGEVIPTSAGGVYMNKFEDGKNRFRILSVPVITFYEAWKTQEDGSRKPVRAKTIKEVSEKGFDAMDTFGEQKPKYKWAVKIFLYNNPDNVNDGGEIKILQFHQKLIMEAIEGSCLSEDWGNPLAYDITIAKEGQKTDTKYLVLNNIPRPLENEKSIKIEAEKINLDKLLTGESPFEEVDTETGEIK